MPVERRNSVPYRDIGFCRLLGWAFGPRNFMRNGGAGASACQLLIRACGWQAKAPAPPGFSILLGWACGPRNFMKNSMLKGGACFSLPAGRRPAMPVVFRTCQAAGLQRGVTDHEKRWSVPPLCYGLRAALPHAAAAAPVGHRGAVSYTHLTLPTNREV